ncbi:MAG: hypothetical protein IPI58_01925 [Alphaproteobacteria bacterium]|nr:MAG: hypothetical protein IPI58_01925 [Alphaproteobacteria bacterium]
MESGIASINLNATASNYTIAGNLVTKESSFTRTTGATGKVVDAWFAYDNVNTVYGGTVALNPRTLLLPQMRGYGQLPDLAIAMSQNAALLGKVEAFTKLNLMTASPVAANDDMVNDNTPQAHTNVASCLIVNEFTCRLAA